MKHQNHGKRAVDQQIPVSFYLARILAIEMYGVCIEGKRREPEEKSLRRRHFDAEIRLMSSYNELAGLLQAK